MEWNLSGTSLSKDLLATMCTPSDPKETRKDLVIKNCTHDDPGETQLLDTFEMPPLPSKDRHAIGRYRVVGVLGRGGFGQVYLAHDDDLDRSVAVKVPNRSSIGGADEVELYLKEAQNLAR